MDSVDLLTSLRTLGCTLRVDGTTLHVSPREVLTPALQDAIRANKPALLALLAADQEPVYRQYYSAVLDADFWLCETQADVEALRAEGCVGYLAEEIWQLQRLRKDKDFAKKLQAIHEAKKLFDATLEGVEHDALPVVQDTDSV